LVVTLSFLLLVELPVLALGWRVGGEVEVGVQVGREASEGGALLLDAGVHQISGWSG
jgi:hypothetical protein